MTPPQKSTCDIQQLEMQNIADGKCPKCGGGGVVADFRTMARIGDPHANKRCGHCKGTGKPTVRDVNRTTQK